LRGIPPLQADKRRWLSGRDDRVGRGARLPGKAGAGRSGRYTRKRSPRRRGNPRRRENPRGRPKAAPTQEREERPKRADLKIGHHRDQDLGFRI